MSFTRLEGLDVSYPFGSVEGTILEENSNELRMLMRVEHNASGAHGLALVPLWRGLVTVEAGDPPRLAFVGQQPWPSAAATVARLGVGKWRFVFGNLPLFAAFAEAVTPGSIASGAVAHVVPQNFAPDSIFSFEVHVEAGNSTTLAGADLPFMLTVFGVQSPEPVDGLLMESGDGLLMESGDGLGF